MDRKGIVQFLKSFVKQQKSEVNYGTYRETNRASLLNDGLVTRANSVWKQSQFVVAYRNEDETSDNSESYLKGWAELTRGIFDQYLILECPKSVWKAYDKNGNIIDLESLKNVPQKEIEKSVWAHKSYLTKDKDINRHLNYLTALRTKPFMLLAGISGTGKSRIVRKLAQATVTEDLQRAEGYKGNDWKDDRWTLHSPANFELIQVKPNWHNSMDVIGYLSNIPSPHYVFTPFIEFIVKAWQHP